MKIDFCGPVIPADDGGVAFRALVDGKHISCRFSMEALQDVNPELTMAAPLVQFESSKGKLLKVAEDRIKGGHAQGGVVWILTEHL